MVSSTRMQMDEHRSVSVRKIKNGFVLSKSKSGPKGYDSEEEYYEKRPFIDIQTTPCVDMKSSKDNINSKALRQASGNRKVKNT